MTPRFSATRPVMRLQGRAGAAKRIALLVALAGGWPCAALAAVGARCVLPDHIPAVSVQPPPAGEAQRNVRTASYVLALTWSPEFCRTHADDPDDAIQCRLNSFGFAVHGLWPNGPGKAHPRYCGQPSLVDAATLRASLCMTPSAWLLQHEWEAHGTCGWATPRSYFAEARALRAALVVPDLAPPPGGAMTAGALRGAFVARNPGMRRNELEVDVNGAGRLQEVLVCYDLAFRLAACHGAGGAPDGATIYVTPKAR